MARVEDEVGLLQRQFVSVGSRPLFQHLVANAPDKDAGVVAVTKHQVGEVALVPLIEEARIVVLGLSAAPHVETLIHDDQTHRVAHRKQLGSGRVVTAADGVDTHGLQPRELAVKGILVEGSAQGTKIVVLADAIDLHVATIEPEACLGVEAEGAEGCGRGDAINYLAANDHFRYHLVDVTLVDIPQQGFPHGEHLALAAAFMAGHDTTVGVEELMTHLRLRGLRTVVVQCHIDPHLPGVALAPLGHGVDAPLGHAQGRGGGEPHMTIDAAARIPTTVGLVAIIDTNGQDVLSRPVEIGGEVVLEGGVAIGARAQGVAVDIDRGVHIDAVEGDEDAIVGRACGQAEMLSVPTYAAGKRAATGATGVANMEVAFDSPVVGQGETAPTTVVIGRGGHRGIVAENKEPVGIKLDARAGLSCEGKQEEKE